MASGMRTLSIHGGEDEEPAKSVAPALFQTAAFAFPDWEYGARVFAEGRGYAYSRLSNPTVRTLERRLAAMAGGEDAVCFASGMGAIAATLLQLLKPGDLLVAHKDLYGSTVSLFHHVLEKWGVRLRFTDMRDLEATERALEGARVVYFETPSNPLMTVLDIRAICERAHAVGAHVVVDNTFATMVLQRPLELGADVVVHSTTKFLSGHGDALGGVVIGPADLMEDLRRVMLRNLGAVMSPFHAWLTLRGLSTLVLRVEAASRSAQRIAEFLRDHPAVEQVLYPGLPEDPGHEVARRQMRSFGAMVAFHLRGGLEAARRFLDRLRVFTRAVSLGDVRSLAQHPASMTHGHLSPEERAAAGIRDSTIRLAIGLEDTEDLIADLRQALGP